jgi:hypothetical protein
MKGQILNESNEKYHSNRAVSFSDIKKLMHSPELFKKHIDGELPREHKYEWDIGSAVHEAILEPNKRPEYYLTCSDYNGSTKEGKALKAEVEAKGQKLLNASNSETALNCINALLNNPCMALFKHGEPEVSWRIGGDKLKVQCRSDWICTDAVEDIPEYGIKKGDCYVVDLKTCRSIDDWMSESRWKNPTTNDLFYAGQEQFYTQIIDTVLAQEGKKVDKWLFVAVEKSEPYRVGVFSLSQEIKNKARNRVDVALQELYERSESGNWSDSRLVGSHEIEVY